MFPRVRSSLPDRAQPIFATNSTHRIPRSFGIPNIMWQTNYTDRITPRVLNYLFNHACDHTDCDCPWRLNAPVTKRMHLACATVAGGGVGRRQSDPLLHPRSVSSRWALHPRKRVVEQCVPGGRHAAKSLERIPVMFERSRHGERSSCILAG